MSAKPALLLVGHGTRSTVGRADFEQLTHLVGGMLADVDVQPAFIEFQDPSIAEGIEHLGARGAREVIVAPLLLFSAGHVKSDVPAGIERALQTTSGLRIRQTPHLGHHPFVVQLSAERWRESLQEFPPASSDKLVTVLVGRGASDRSAVAEMRQFAKLRQDLTPDAHIRHAFLALASPSLEEIAAHLTEQDATYVTVQPHLLLRGKLLDRLQEWVAAIDEARPAQRWILAEHLGPAPRLAEAVVDRYSTLAGDPP